MKTKLHFLVLNLLIGLIPILGFSQCPTTNITLSSQADVDAFTTNYPSCTELQSPLIISGADITDLTPLSSITSVFTLSISNNPLLSNLQGLDNVTHFDGLYGLNISNNNVLTDISALINMTNDSDIGNIGIANNPLLNSLNGLQGIQGYISAVDIVNNDSLINLTGLNNITSADDFYVNYNDNLVNLIGLDSCTGGALIFEYNSSLQNLVGLTSSFNGGLVALSGNASLESLQGIEAITATADLYIDGNESLTDISALTDLTPGNLSFPEISIIIRNNINLATCHIEAICTALSLCNSGDYYCTNIIENNAEGCNSIMQVNYNCGIVPSNDECTEAFDLTIGETLEAYNELATESAEVPACNDTNRADVWFTFNTGAFDSVDIITSAGYNLQLWSGTCGALSQVSGACDADSLVDISVSTSSNYFLQVWSCDGCRLTTGLFDILIQDGLLSTEDDVFNGLSIFPNPTNSVLNLKSNNQITLVKVHNLLGQQILSSTPNALTEEINLTELNSGMYLVSVEINNRSVVYRVVKE